MAAVNPVPPQAPGTSNGGQPWALYLMLLFAIGLLLAMVLDAPIMKRLVEPGAARGLITFTISVATIGLAFTLVYQAFYSSDAGAGAAERFRRAREVFTGLMGILGTIVGFYFGSSDGGVARMEVAEMRLIGTQLRTHATGGTAPYRYSISSDQTSFNEVKNQLSEDGWITQDLVDVPATGKLRLEISDSRGQKATREMKLPPDNAESASARKPADGPQKPADGAQKPAQGTAGPQGLPGPAQPERN